MADRDLLARMKANPAGDWTIVDVRRVALAHGAEFIPGSGTSHCHVKHLGSRILLTIPAHRPIKPVYIRKLVRYIESAGARI